MIGSSSVEESLSSDDTQLLLAALVGLRCFLNGLGVGSSSPLSLPSTITVVSARARPRESMVNFTEVLVFGAGLSGMAHRLESLWWFFSGEVLPFGRELFDSELVSFCGTGRIAGTRGGRVADRMIGFFALFSLKLLDNPGRGADLPDGFKARFPADVSLVLADRLRFAWGSSSVGD